MTTSTPLDLTRDTTPIKGIYDACDLWCMYCNVIDRCLLFRCRPESRHARVAVDDGDSSWIDGLKFLSDLAQAEERRAPIEIDAFLSDDRRKKAYLFGLDDPLERLGGSYMKRAEAYLRSRPDYPFEIAPRPSGPTPLEVFAWFHDLVPARIFRALLSAGAARAGLDDRGEDALVAAKIALVGIDRSDDALGAIAAEDDDPRLQALRTDLRHLRCEVEARFPGARDFVRPGLD